MQPSSLMSNFISFKDEMMKKIRLLENKLSSDFNSKYSQVNFGFEKLDSKIKAVSQTNNVILELIAKQNFNYEKINELENYKEKIGKDTLSHEVKIKNIFQEIERIKEKYDKIINDNLIVLGHIGPGCLYKNLSEYLQSSINQYQKIKYETEQIKNRIDNSTDNTIDMIKNSYNKFQQYADDKNKEIKMLIDRKFFEFKEFQTQVYQFQYKTEEQIKFHNNILEELLKSKNDPEINGEKKFEDINRTIYGIIEELEEIKLNNKEFNDNILGIDNEINEINNKIKEFKQNNHQIHLLNSKNVKFKVDNSNKNINEVNENIKSKNSSKKDINKILKEESSNGIIQKNSSIINHDSLYLDNNTNSNQMENISQIQKNICNEDNSIKENLDINKNYKQNNKIKDNINYINNDNSFSSKGIINENEKQNKIHNNNNNQILKNNILSNVSFKNDKYIKLSINNNKEKENNNFNNNNKNKIFVKDINKEFSKLESNIKNNSLINDKKIAKKISIDSLHKQKKLSHVNSFINININKLKKFDEGELDSNKNKILSFYKNEDKKVSTISADKFIEKKIGNNDKGYNNTKITANKYIITPKNYSRNINFDNNIINQYSLNNKKIFNLKKDVHIEQPELMKKLGYYYNGKKLKIEKKPQDNIVDCNIINLNLIDLSNSTKNNYKNSSARNTFYSSSKSKMKENRNSLREIASLERTNYRFFSTKNKIHNFKNFNSFENKKNLKYSI